MLVKPGGRRPTRAASKLSSIIIFDQHARRILPKRDELFDASFDKKRSGLVGAASDNERAQAGALGQKTRSSSELSA
jgi:hypothetical protein